jgi:type II secretory pathway pseudopilin PulG
MAIESYYSAIPGKAQLPQSLDDLLSDSRTAKGTRHLRQKYPDPMTGGDFDVLRDQARGNRITGVCSTSNREPLRKTDFPDPYQEFEGKKTYKDWKFLFVPKQPAAPPVKPPAPP